MEQISIDTLEPCHLATFLFPDYASDREARPLISEGLVVLDPDCEEYRHTPEGARQHAILRNRHAMGWRSDIPGGGRWVVQGHQLHCGDPLEVLRPDGTWLPVRFEVEKCDANCGRKPVLFLSLGGGGALRCNFEIETACFRLPGTSAMGES